MQVKFKRDTKFRKQLFVPDSFAHPAKMDAQLLLWIVQKYTEPGELVLDPMSGSGTLMLAYTMGRDVVLVELEDKFCKMMRDNWEKVKQMPQLGSEMGRCEIIQGDARQLEGLLVDKIITSPPYAETGVGDWQTGRAEFQEWVLNELAKKGYVEWQGKRYTESEWRAMNHGRIDGRTTKGVHKHPTDGYGETEGQIGNLPYGQVDKIVTSPPYEGIEINPGHQAVRSEGLSLTYPEAGVGYNRANVANIGNLKSQSYLEAMLQVYQQCFSVLKDGGLMILVVKNFIRDKAIVRLDQDTIKLCEQAGFEYVERHYRKLPSQSFWRVIYKRRYPSAPTIDNEDILVFGK